VRKDAAAVRERRSRPFETTHLGGAAGPLAGRPSLLVSHDAEMGRDCPEPLTVLQQRSPDL